ncbi:hypothetical protein [Neolewinella antarctica]|uniref:DUF3575 domain-containing protein n=1 Tax=Neolewinella antarctica TaxID=442734 RepID=A0ABX0XDB8_9BACT|nr:hypothetical protein [Neolewinella antarctica]NJC26908.1 hypothetical protein [Neolewinella antarctica]
MRTYFAFALLFMLTPLTAQSDIREVGVRFNNFDNFNLLLKKQIDENTYRRYGLLLANVNLLVGENDVRAAQFEVSASIGKERRRDIGNDIQFVTGWQPSIGLGLTASESVTCVSVTPGIGYLLGFQYNISDNFYVAVEAIPSVNFALTVGDIAAARLQAGISTAGVGITAVYRFVKE